MRPVRLFTPVEADACLPLVRTIVRDLRQAHARWVAAVGDYELHAANLRADDDEPPVLLAARETVTAEAVRVDALLEELHAIGAEFKSFELGLVDFPSLRDDQPVLLCWQDGEPSVSHWHAVNDGFAGRQPLDAAIFHEADA